MRQWPLIEPAWSEWLESRPDSVRYVAIAYPPDTCYRAEHGGHYQILSYFESGNVRVLHGSDSFAPGFEVFEFGPQHLTPCGCGKWEPANQQGVLMALERAERILGAAIGKEGTS